ncbi:MAG: MATE family efflux transporter [bacterium]|nr:MATE family efflux transporter [bacterium]MBU1918179.1 MATE family efflux transporter [bacterium]
MYKYIKELLILAWPIIFGHLGHILIGAGDVFVAGRHSADMLAACGIANGFFVLIYGLGIGLLLGISPVLSKERGAGKTVEQYMWLCLAYSVFVSLLCIVFVRLSVHIVPLVGMEDKLVPMIQDYLLLRSWALIGTLVFFGIKEFLQAHEDVIFANSVTLLAVGLNVLFNFVFVFGLWGFPEMKMQGLALSSLLMRTLMMFILLFYARQHLFSGWNFCLSILKKIIKIGWPMGLTLFVEIAGFVTITLLVSRISTLQTAAHNIALEMASITFMIPMSIAAAASVKIGHAYGQGSFERMKGFAIAAIMVSSTIMICSMALFLTLPKVFLGIFTIDPHVIAIGVPIVLLAALFQLFDGLQVTLGGVLRGMQISKPIFVTQVSAYWFVGIPLGYYLAFYRHQEVMGLWVGLSVALFTAAFCLALVLFFHLKKLKNHMNY